MNTIELDKDIVVNRYNNGDSCPIIAKDYKINSGTVYYYLKKWGVKTRKIQVYPKIEDNENQIIDLFNSGVSCYKIAKDLNIPKPNIIHFLKKKGLDTSIKSTQREDKLVNHEDDIINMYLSGLSTVKIGKHWNSNSCNIWKILKKHNITTRPKSTYTVDESYFENIDTEYKAYILGWIYSDGNVMSDRWRIQIQEEDSYMLEWIAKQVQYTGPLYTIPPSVKFPHRKWQKCLNITRNKMVVDLAKLGVMPKKSLIIGFPTEEQVPRHLISHFLRGVMDGDGSIKRYKSGVINCSFVCSNKFLSGFKHFSVENDWVYNTYAKKKSQQVMFTEHEYAKQFLDFIYSNSSIYLSRKYNKYIMVE